jgi:pimeloyl-ACP methyl ester carboxylesterase
MKADVVAEFIRVVAGDSASVIGESFGGGAVAWLAIRHSAVVARLMLAAPAGLSQAGGKLPTVAGGDGCAPLWSSADNAANA